MTSLTLERIEHGTLSQRVAEAMLNYILANDLRPGATLPAVASLAEQLGASRPIVRESLNALRALGIIEITNGKKATIRDLDNGVLRIYFGRALQIVDGSMRDVMDVRIGVESRSAALAARNRGEADIARSPSDHGADAGGRAHPPRRSRATTRRCIWPFRKRAATS